MDVKNLNKTSLSLKKINEEINQLPPGNYIEEIYFKREELYLELIQQYKYKKIYYSNEKKCHCVDTKSIFDEINDIQSSQVNNLYSWYESRGTLLAFSIEYNYYDGIDKLLKKGARIDVENIPGSKPTSLSGRKEYYTINCSLTRINQIKQSYNNTGDKIYNEITIKIRSILELLLKRGLIIENMRICDNLIKGETDLAKRYYNKLRTYKILIIRIKLPEEILLHIFDILFNIKIYDHLKNLLN